MEINEVVPALAVGILLSYALLKWALGLRAEAAYYLWVAMEVGAWVFVAWAALQLADMTSRAIAGMGVEASWNALASKAPSLAALAEKVRDWIFWEAKAEAYLILSIILQPFASWLNAATSVPRFLMLISVAVVYGTYFVAEILRPYWPVLMTLGATLITVPRLRSIGAPLYAFVLVYGPALVVMSNAAGAALASMPIPPPPNPFPFDLGRILTAVQDMEKAGYAVYECAVRLMVGHAVAGALSVAVSGALGGPGIRLRV